MNCDYSSPEAWQTQKIQPPPKHGTVTVPWCYGDSCDWATPRGSRRQATCSGRQTSCLLVPPQALWDPQTCSSAPRGGAEHHSVTRVGLRDPAPALPCGCTTAMPPLKSSWNLRFLLASAMRQACLSQPACKNWEKALRCFKGQAELIWTVRDLCNFSEDSPSGGAKWKLSPMVTVIRSLSDLLQLQVQEHLGQAHTDNAQPTLRIHSNSAVKRHHWYLNWKQRR